MKRTFLFVTAMLMIGVASAQQIVIPYVPDVNVTMPDVPVIEIIYEDGKPKTKGSTSSSPELQEILGRTGIDRSIIFSMRVPPGYGVAENYVKDQEVGVGEVNNGRASLYLRGPYMDVKTVKKLLKKAGFKVLGSYKIDKKKRYQTVVFTDPALDAMAALPGRGYIGSLRVLIDKAGKQISITNPIYLGRAFMQEEYDDTAAMASLTKLRETFEGLADSEDKLKAALLPKYHFMTGLPFYQDMITVGVGESHAQLLEEARKSKKVVFEHTLSPTTTLLGVKLGRRTTKFVKKIGYQNAALLPYPVLIEGEKAKILEPRYYIALMYPMLTMSDFMTIATVPGAIERDCSKIFR